MDPQEIADEILAIDARQKIDAKRITQLKQDLIACGAGDYLGSKGGKATVITPASSLAINDAALDEAQTNLESVHFKKLFEKHEGWVMREDAIDYARENLEPAHFKKLFEKVTSYTLVKGFRDIAGALLTAAKASRLIKLFEKPNSAYVKITAA